MAGDTEALASVESPEMVVISPQGAEPAAERAQAIDHAVRSGRWFPTGSHAIDQPITWRALSATVAHWAMLLGAPSPPVGPPRQAAGAVLMGEPRVIA